MVFRFVVSGAEAVEREGGTEAKNENCLHCESCRLELHRSRIEWSVAVMDGGNEVI